MARHGFGCWVALVVALITGMTSVTRAAFVIDTLSTWDNIYYVNAFGEGSTPTYGQTITVPSDNILESFTFKLLQGGGNPSTIRFLVQAWDGSKVTGPVLLQTGPVTLLNTGFYEDYTVTTGGLPLVSGSKYALYFTSFLDNDGQPDASAAAAHSYTTDPYLGGQFIDNNDAQSLAGLATGGWFDGFLGTGDLAFRAEFSSTPEPTSIVVFSLIAVSAAGPVARRACSRWLGGC